MARTRLTQAEKKARTRADLLDAAARLIAARGFERATLDEIAEEAGYTKGAIYHHFSSKEDLLLELVEHRADEGRLAVAQVLADHDGLAERMVALDRWHAGDERRAREWALLEVEIALLAARRPALAERIRTNREDVRAPIAMAVEALAPPVGERASVTPAELTPAELARVFVALSDGLLVDRLIDPGSQPGDLLSRTLAALLGLSAVGLDSGVVGDATTRDGAGGSPG